MMWVTMGNRLLPRSSGGCITLDTSAGGSTDRLTLDTGTAAGTPTDGGTPASREDGSAAEEPAKDELKPPTLTPVRNSFEIMSEFTWEMVDTLKLLNHCTCHASPSWLSAEHVADRLDRSVTQAGWLVQSSVSPGVCAPFVR